MTINESTRTCASFMMTNNNNNNRVQDTTTWNHSLDLKFHLFGLIFCCIICSISSYYLWNHVNQNKKKWFYNNYLLWSNNNNKGKESDCQERKRKFTSFTNKDFHHRLERKNDFIMNRCKNNYYGYSSSKKGFIDDWRHVEIPNLITPCGEQQQQQQQQQQHDDTANTATEVYLDYAGSALPTQSQMKEIINDTNKSILANPHSTGIAAYRTYEKIQNVKMYILNHFNANININNHPGYEIIFTSGSTHSLQIIAERFNWSNNCDKKCKSSYLLYPPNVHTSVIGMRYAIHPNKVICKPIKELLNRINNKTATLRTEEESHESHSSSSCTCSTTGGKNLLVVPLECNFTGDRLGDDTLQSLALISSNDDAATRGKNNNTYVMMDIAKAASTGPINLCKLNPDFACVSFYKLFGVPTGLGCLFVKRTSINALRLIPASNNDKQQYYFGGGSVNAIIPTTNFTIPRTEPTPLISLEHGTCHFRGIISLLSGFHEIERLGGMNIIQRHTQSLTIELIRRLRTMKHGNGKPVISIYGDWNNYDDNSNDNSTTTPGPIVAFNIRRADGTYVGYNEVSKLATINSPPIQLRTGCFCNPGACQIALQLSDDDIIRNYTESGHVCGDHIDIINNKPTGAIRVSFGKDSIWEDLDTLILFIEKMFVQRCDESLTVETKKHKGPQHVSITELYIFPIKSCAAQRVQNWDLDRLTGRLVFDREFALVDSSGIAMRLQTYPRMAYIRPEINQENLNIMKVYAENMETLTIDLSNEENKNNHPDASIIRVCGNRCNAYLYGDYTVSDWFSRFIGVKCWLARYSDNGYKVSSTVQNTTIPRPINASRNPDVAFANEQPLLLVSEHAVEYLNTILKGQGQQPVCARRFRPNIVVRLKDHQITAYQTRNVEEHWSTLLLERGCNKVTFNVVGPCARCSMVDVDPNNGSKVGKTLKALAEYRRSRGQITFGVFLHCTTPDGDACVNVDRIRIQEGDTMICYS